MPRWQIVRERRATFAATPAEAARQARRESFERAREAGLTLREIGEAADLHWSRVGEVLKK